jgi:transposase
MARKRGSKQKRANDAALPIMRPDAAGIDIGATEIFVALPADRATENVRSFPTFYPGLVFTGRLAAVLRHQDRGDGVQWRLLDPVVSDSGRPRIEVCLANARHVRNVPGRRTDVSDCQWLQFLHSVGLLRASYRPDEEVCAIRSLLRHRESLVQMATTHVNRRRHWTR